MRFGEGWFIGALALIGGLAGSELGGPGALVGCLGAAGIGVLGAVLLRACDYLGKDHE